jgi:hypothetical protein
LFWKSDSSGTQMDVEARMKELEGNTDEPPVETNSELKCTCM